MLCNSKSSLCRSGPSWGGLHLAPYIVPQMSGPLLKMSWVMSPGARFRGPLPPGSEGRTQPTQSLSSPHPSAGPSISALPTKLLPVGTPAVAPAPLLLHWGSLPSANLLIVPISQLGGRGTEKPLTCCLFRGPSCWALCLEAQALRAKRGAPGLGHRLSWEEKSSAVSSSQSSLQPDLPPSAGKLGQGAGTQGAPEAACSLPADLPARVVFEDQTAWRRPGNEEAANGALCREERKYTLNHR